MSGLLRYAARDPRPLVARTEELAAPLGFALFLLVNAMLFIRPAELSETLSSQPIYEVCILSCLVINYQVVLAQFEPRNVIGRPMNTLVMGILPAIVLSQLARGNLEAAHADGVEFLKLLLYYVLLVGVIDTVDRLRGLLTGLSLFALVATSLAVLHYHGIVEVSTLRFVRTGIDDTGRADAMIQRLGSTGLFQDPNDMCLMLVMAMTICLYQILEHRRWLWGGPLVLFGHALMLTHSRGGFLAMMGALSMLLLARLGRRAVPIGMLVLPAVVVIFAGRQTSFGDALGDGGTGTSRIQLWADGLALFVNRPLFGIGSNQYANYAGHVAHNSFIHGYVELGLLGGTCFLGAFYLAFWSLVRLGGREVPRDLLGHDLDRLRPYVLAIVTGYGVGLLSLSCTYTIPTYTVIGLAAVYVRLAERALGVPVVRLDGRLAFRLVCLSLAFAGTAATCVRLIAY